MRSLNLLHRVLLLDSWSMRSPLTVQSWDADNSSSPRAQMNDIHVLLEIGHQLAAMWTRLLVELTSVPGQMNIQGVTAGDPLAANVTHHPVCDLVHPLHVSL